PLKMRLEFANEHRHRSFGSLATQFLERSPGDHAFPVRYAVHTIDFEADVRVLTHHMHLHAVARMRVNRAAIVDVRDWNHVRAAKGVNADAADNIFAEDPLD